MVLSIIIPTLNERNYLPKVLKKIGDVELLGFTKQIVIVDDGSTDGTSELIGPLKLQYKGLIYIESDRNYGKAHAIREGLKACKGEIVLIQDADLEYDPADYPALLKPFTESKAQVVYGSRILNKSNGKSSELYFQGGKLLSFVTNTIYGSKITDEATCYKVFDRKLLESLNIRSMGFEFCPEVTGKVLCRGIKIYEVPIKYYPRNRKEGKKINAVKDGLKAVWTLLKYRFIK